MQAKEILFALLRAEICGGTVSDEVVASIDAQKLAEVYALAAQHDLAHIVGKGLEKLSVTGCDDILSKFKQQTLQAIYRYVKLDYDYGQVCQAFENAQIPYIPLKGAVLRAYYPEPWMRTSCDTDILVRKEDVKAAAKILTEQLGFRYHRRGTHDVAFYSPNEIHFELHYNLIEELYSRQQIQILNQVWQQALPMEGFAYQRKMPDELFYFYHIAHMAKHLVNGGCGIRPFLDLWILNCRLPHQRQARETLLQQGQRQVFAQAASALAQVWFGDGEQDELSRQLEQFVFTGGMYGSYENKIAIRKNKTGSGLRFVISRLFLPYEVMCGYYPVLQKHKWLLPLFQIMRWVQRPFQGGIYRAALELRINTATTSQQASQMGVLMKELGLQDADSSVANQPK